MTTIKPDAIDRVSPTATPWLAVINVLFAGIAAALHVGKATIALPALQTEFGRSLEALSWVISAFPFVGVFGGIAAGLLVRRWGDRRLLALGLLIISAASFTGATLHDFSGLIVSRFVEGLGFVIVVVASPAVLNRIVAPAQRSLVFGIWSTFMPAGIAISLFFGPHLAGWQQNWQAGAALTLLLPLTTPRRAADAHAPPLPLRQALGAMLRARQPLLLALMFTAYNLQFFSVMTFLPIFLMQRIGLTLAAAGGISAAAVAANIIGNLAAGVLLSRGLRARTLLAATSLVIGIFGIGIFLPVTPNGLLIPLCFLFCAIAGMLPATLLAATPAATPEPTLLPLSLGLVMQGNYLGQVIGPVALSAIVAAAGWAAPAWLVLAAAVSGAGLALIFRRGPRNAA
ncbi:CynX/NimT family MFS transporter [Serratia sp. CY81489]|uniref:MFS transporter n=1 Tax=unclassified Serratia (in: enterobacteria) TaxID=2647522 RepID=UPI000CBEB1F7|nr:MFS transporter [Serratia ureilytica]